MPNVDGGSLWELVERRAAATPDALAAVDEDGRTLTWAEAKTEAERAAAGLARHGIGAGDVVSWQLPTWLESKLLVLALARLGAIQNPMLPIYREREVGFITRQAKSKLLVVPSTWSGFDFEAMAKGIAAAIAEEGGGPLEVLVADKALPQGDPSTLPPPPDPADDTVRWYFYTSGTTADPKGALHTDRTIKASAVGMCERLEITDADVNAVVFPFTHIGGIGWLFSALVYGFPTVYIERFDPAKTIEMIQQHNVTLAGAGTPFHMAYLAAQRQLPDGRAAVPERARLPGRRRAEAAAAALRHQGRDGRRRHRVGLRAHRGADHRDGQRARLRRAARQHRGQGHRHHAAAHRHARGQGGRHRRGGRDPRQGPAAHEGLPRQHASTPRPSTRTAGSRPATSAASTPTAWSRSPVG